LHNFVENLGEEMTDEEFNYKIASILREVDEEAHGAFYMRQRRQSYVETVPSHPVSRLSSPHNSRRSSRVSVKLPSHQLPPKPAPFSVEDFQAEVVILRRLTEDYSHLVSIFDSDDADMDSYIISALLSSAGVGTPSGMLNTEQLEIAVRLNRADIAKEKIFTEGRSWKKHELDTFMFNAILADQEAFVSLFLENGFDLEAFLTVHMLEKLYTAGLTKRVMLRDIGRVLRQLLGEFYRPYYLSKRFREVIKRAITRYDAEAKEVLITGNPWSKRSSGFASFSAEPTVAVSLGSDMPPAEEASMPAPSETLAEPRKSLIKHEGMLKQPTQTQRSSRSFVLQAGRRRGVVRPIPVETGNGQPATANGLNGAPPNLTANGRQLTLGSGRVGRCAVRRIANGSIGPGDRSIWSMAPVALEEPELESTPPRRRQPRLKADSSISGEVNQTFQRSLSEQSCEATGSPPSGESSDSSRKVSSVESKQTVVTGKHGFFKKKTQQNML
uniref:Ion_trans domain-containing protein n=1 Tax=Schistocephalus solidus TaxID=70667 RepID=A0A183SDT5_SCHSO